MRTAVAFCLAAVASCTTVNPSPSTDAGAANAAQQHTQSTGAVGAMPAEDGARRASEEEVQAFLHRDVAAMERLWSDDLVVTNPLNRFVHKQDVLGMMQSGFLVITSYDRRIEYGRAYGDIVILAGSETVIWGGRMPLAGKSQELRFTALWMKQNGRWQEIARHANVIPQT